MFKDNKYYAWYNTLVKNAKSKMRKKNDGLYLETHHILPRCMGGKNGKKNLVLFTAREHYIAHWLLIYCAEDEFISKLKFAFFMMSGCSEGQHRAMPSHVYERAKNHMVAACSSRTPHKVDFTDGVRKKMSDAKRDMVIFHHPDTKKRSWVHVSDLVEAVEQGLIRGTGQDMRGDKNPAYGKAMSDDTKGKISKSKIGKSWTSSDEEIERRRQNWKTNNPNNNPVAMAKSIEKRAKTYTVTSPDGVIQTVKNLAQFCRDNALSTPSMCSVASGRLKQYKGWLVSKL